MPGLKSGPISEAKQQQCRFVRHYLARFHSQVYPGANSPSRGFLSHGMGRASSPPPNPVPRMQLYFRVFTKAASAAAWSAVTVLIALMCGALASPPLVRTSTTFLVVPTSLGAFMAGFPCPWSPWHMAHLVLNSVAPSWARAGMPANRVMDATTAVAMRSFICVPLSVVWFEKLYCCICNPQG